MNLFTRFFRNTVNPGIKNANCIATFFLMAILFSHANAQMITTLAGNGAQGYSGDGGPAKKAILNTCDAVAFDGNGNLYISDRGNQCIRKVTPNGIISTIAGNGKSGFSGDGGPATSAQLNGPISIAVDAAGNNIYVADEYNHRVRKISNGIITTVAGNGVNGYSGDKGLATAAALGAPVSVALDGNGNLYVGDWQTFTVRKINQSGIITTVAGNGRQGFSGDGGAATLAQLNYTWGIAIDKSGNLYISDTYNNRIRKVTTDGIIRTIAGNGAQTNSGDGGLAVNASLILPHCVAVDNAGNIYTSDAYQNHIVREINMSNGGIISTIAGNGVMGYSGDGGLPVKASLNGPYDVTLDANGNVFIAEQGNSVIREILIKPVITTGGSVTAFNSCAGIASVSQSVTVGGSGLTGNLSITAPVGYELSLQANGTYTSNITLNANSGSVSPTTIYIRLSSTATGNPSGNISIASSGASSQTIAVSGTVNGLPKVTIGTIAALTTASTSFSIPYTSVLINNGNPVSPPDHYSISPGIPAMNGFVSINNATIPVSPIPVTIPASVANTYQFNLIVNNSITGCASNPEAFSVVVNNPLPVINSISPATGPVGTLITITGSNLRNTTAITVGGVSAIPVSNNGSSLVAMVMPGSASGAVAISIAGAIVKGPNFTVTATPYPSVHQGNKLVGSAYMASSQVFEGAAVAISADGNTAIIGGHSDGQIGGAAWIFTRSNSGNWAQQGKKLIPSDATGNPSFGGSVAISADGNTVVIGGSNDNHSIGAAWIFTRDNSGNWNQQAAKLVGTGAVGAANQGSAVSISADGNTILMGGSADNNYIGAAWIFNRNGSTWAQQGSKMVGTGYVFMGQVSQGSSVGLSADAKTAVVGGFGDNNYTGALWVFTKNNSGNWTQQGNKLVGNGNLQADLGTSVAISADGNTVISAGQMDATAGFGVGAAYVFIRNGNAWTQQGNQLIGSGFAGRSSQGSAVSLSADGNTAIVGGPLDNSGIGATWVYTRNGNTWKQQGNKLNGSGAIGNAYQGSAVAISANANTVIIGGPWDNNAVGASWIYIAGNPSPSIITSASLTAFKTCTGIPSTSQNFTVSGNNLTGNIIVTAPVGYELSNSVTGKYGVTDTLVPVSGTVASTIVYVRISSNANGTPAGTINLTSTGATAQTIGVSGTLNALPSAPVVTNSRPLSFCNGDSTILTSSATTGIQWQLNNTNITGATGTKITAKQSGAYTVVTTNSNGCSSVSATTTVKNNPIPGPPLISTSGNATAFCTGSYLVLSSDSASGNQWYYNGTAVTTAKGVNDTARAAGNYALQYTSSAGCISPLSAAKAITVNALPPIPTISSKGSTSFCQGLYDILLSSSTTGNQWKLNGTAIAKASTLQSFVANIAGNYSVTVTNAAGCTATSAATAITILPTPAKPVITEDANLNLVSSATKGNQWYSPELLTGDTSKVYTPWVNGTYYVQVTVGGCISPMSDAYVYNNPNLNKESLRATGTSTLDSKAVQLYPNPVGNTLKISYQISGIQNVTAEIMDMNGTIIARKESITSGSNIDVSGYASGMYIIRLVNGENQQVLYTTKVVKVK